VPAADDDWRLRRQERYLQGATLVWREWSSPAASDLRAWRMSDGSVRESSEPVEAPAGAVERVEPRGWDHDHCDFCWAKFMAREIAEHDPEILAAGYTIASEKRSTFWICPSCFEDFKERFAWTVVPSEGAG